MTLRERQKFLRGLTKSVLKSVLSDAAVMPEEWDGHELRRFLADRFEMASFTMGPGKKEHRQRYKRYKNTCLINNIPSN